MEPELPGETEEESELLDLTLLTSDRYARLRLINWWDQQRLANARVMIVGAGALGNEVLKNLALLGIGQIVVVDYDTIERSNLARTVLFREADIGRAKAIVAAERACALSPDIGVIPIVADFAHGVGLGLVRRMDVVISCLDSRQARRAVNLACWRAGKIWVDGALDALDGLIRVFSPDTPGTACYECTLSEEEYRLLDMHYSCPPGVFRSDGLYPTTATAASIVGAMQAQEVLKLLHKLDVQVGCVTYYSGQSLRTTTVQYTVRADCPAHERYTPVMEMPEGSADLTVRQFLLTVGERFRDEATLVLPASIVTRSRCERCGHVEGRTMPYHQLSVDGVLCGKCGGRCEIEITSALRAHSPLASLPLSRFAIPPFEVLVVRTAGAQYYVELTGDAEALLGAEVHARGER